MSFMQVMSPDELLVDVVNELATRIPTNEFGMPAFIYRPDTIPANLRELPESAQKQHLEMSKVPLYYNDGFPTTRQGTLFWDRLDHESNADFMLFRKYLEMSQAHGYRSVQVLARAMHEQHVASTKYLEEQHQERASQNIFLDVETPSSSPSPSPSPSHNVVKESIDDMMMGTLGYLRQLYVLNFWYQRAEAFDLVGQAAVRKIRETRAILLEDTHYIKLNGMVEKVMGRFERFTAEDLDNLNPVDTVKIMKELIQLQRVTTGLPAAAPSDSHLPGKRDESGAGAMSVEDHLRTINKSRAQNNKEDSKNLLDDEQTTELAQELFMRIMRGKQ